MESNQFTSLTNDAIYKFTTYMDETIEGIPYTENIDGLQNFYVILAPKARDFINSKLLIAEKVRLGIMIPINPDIIDEYEKINF
jgi:hypothetical protein